MREVKGHLTEKRSILRFFCCFYFVLIFNFLISFTEGSDFFCFLLFDLKYVPSTIFKLYRDGFSLVELVLS